MGVAKLVPGESYIRSVTLDDLYDLLSDVDGVLEWTLDLNGEVAVEYDHNRVSEETIEQTLSGTGLQLRAIVNDPNISDLKKVLWDFPW